jgi:uracil-DNA glycosylase
LTSTARDALKDRRIEPAVEDASARQIALAVLQADLRACTRCVDAGYIPESRPLASGSAAAHFLVIGQAPSRTDHVTGIFYHGPAGARLRGWFAEAGFTPEEFGTTVYPAAITRCFPGRLAGSSKDRMPSRAEQALCRPWLDAEITLIRPRVTVLFGRLAIETFLSHEPLSALVGRSFEKDGLGQVIPMPHSSGASTWLNSPANRALLTEAIARLREAREHHGLAAEQGVQGCR